MKKKNELVKLAKRLNSRIPEERMNAIRMMGMLVVGKNAPKSILNALKDKDELVRIEASESLGNIRDRKTLPALRKTLNDRSPLVRRYVAIAIGKFGIEGDIGRLCAKCRRDRNPISRVGYWQALYILGKKDSLQKLLAFLKHQDYRIRCASAHALESTRCRDSDSAVAIQALKERSRYETTIAAQSSIQSSLRALKKKSRRGKNRDRLDFP